MGTKVTASTVMANMVTVNTATVSMVTANTVTGSTAMVSMVTDSMEMESTATGNTVTRISNRYTPAIGGTVFVTTKRSPRTLSVGCSIVEGRLAAKRLPQTAAGTSGYG